MFSISMRISGASACTDAISLVYFLSTLLLEYINDKDAQILSLANSLRTKVSGTKFLGKHLLADFKLCVGAVDVTASKYSE